MRLLVLLTAALVLAGSASAAFADNGQMKKAANAAHAEITIGLACKNSGYKAEIYDLSLKRAVLLLEGGGYSVASAQVLAQTYRKQAEAGPRGTITSGACDRVFQSFAKPVNDKAWMGSLPACKSAQRPAWCPAT